MSESFKLSLPPKELAEEVRRRLLKRHPLACVVRCRPIYKDLLQAAVNRIDFQEIAEWMLEGAKRKYKERGY